MIGSKALNKLIRNIAVIFEIVFVLAFLMINYFAETRMGMMRHIVYKNQYWSQIFNHETIVILNILIIAVLMINIFFIKRNGLKKSIDQIISVVFLFVSSNCISIFNETKIFTYYYMVIAVILIFICEIIKIIPARLKK